MNVEKNFVCSIKIISDFFPHIYLTLQNIQTATLKKIRVQTKLPKLAAGGITGK
jgi:hypothetical protein